MPLHALTLPWDKFRGAVRSSDPIGGMVLYDSPHVGCVSRQFVIPANPRTTLQTQQRGRLATSAKGWVDLDADTAAAWRALARQLTRSNALGFTYVLTGIGLFNMVNTYRLIAGLPVDDSTPDIARIPVPPPVDPLAWSNGTTLIVDLPSHGNDATIHALVRVTNSIATAARLLRPCDLRIPTANTVDRLDGTSTRPPQISNANPTPSPSSEASGSAAKSSSCRPTTSPGRPSGSRTFSPSPSSNRSSPPPPATTTFARRDPSTLRPPPNPPEPWLRQPPPHPQGHPWPPRPWPPHRPRPPDPATGHPTLPRSPRHKTPRTALPLVLYA